MVKAKKSLGQNFLRSDKAIREIVEAGRVGKSDTVLEIGPGEGVLTRALLDKGARVIAIEKDDRLIIELNNTFKDEISQKSLILIHGDVLDLVGKDAMSANLAKLLGKSYKLIANIPYYITGEIIERFHTVPNNPVLMVLLVQKEVAERIIARDGKESILSIAVKMYGTPQIVSIVPRGAFVPAPNVDSAILCIKDIQHFGSVLKEKEFFDILHASFAHKRKLMLSNIKSLPTDLQDRVKKVFTTNNLDINTRAEDIHIGIWKKVV